MQFKGLGVPNKYFATQNKQMYIRLHCLLALRTIKLPFQSSRVIFLGRSPAEEHLPAVIQARECMKKKKLISEEQHYLCEIGLEKMPYRSSWLFKSYTEESHTHRNYGLLYCGRGFSSSFHCSMGESMGLPCRASQVGILRLSGKRFEPSVRKKRKILIPTWVYSCCVRHEENRSENCRIVLPQMGVSRMGYGYCNIIYGQIRQKSLIFFVYL